MEHIQILRHILEMSNKRYVSFGDYSITGIIDPPRVTALKKRYEKEITPSPRGKIGSLIGMGVHEFCAEMLKLYQVLDPKYELERTVMDVFTVFDQRRLLTGRFDILYDRKHLTDIKTANVWKKIFDPDMIEWHQQLNLYAYLLHRRGIDVEDINVMAIYKDWKEIDAIRDKSYPQDQVQEYRLKLWSWEESERFLYERMGLHVACEEISDEELPECSPDERWERFKSGKHVEYALMKNKEASRATKVEDDLAILLEYTKKAKTTADSFIEVRHAVRKRCEKYCDYRDYCNHYIDYINKKKTNTLNDIYPLSHFGI